MAIKVDTPDEKPADPTGGYQRCADLLTALAGRPITRQQVYMWWRRRATSQFPEGDERPSYNGATQIREFSLAEVETWWRVTRPQLVQ